VSTASHRAFVTQAVEQGDAVGGVGWRKGKALFTWGQMEDCTEVAGRANATVDGSEDEPEPVQPVPIQARTSAIAA
jgi:hypothetical protein